MPQRGGHHIKEALPLLCCWLLRKNSKDSAGLEAKVIEPLSLMPKPEDAAGLEAKVIQPPAIGAYKV